MKRLLKLLQAWWHHSVSFENGWQCSHLSGKDGDRVRKFCQRPTGHFGQHRFRK